MRLSVVIPAYNEENRIGPSLKSIHDYFKNKNYETEIIVVDDGSHDRTSEITHALAGEIPELVVLRNTKNRGKGFSIKKGVLESKGQIILFSDADLSAPIEEFEKLAAWIDKGYPIAIGSRSLPDSQVEVRQAWFRQGMGKTFNKIIRSLLKMDYQDTQCGFKCFQRSAALDIFGSLELRGFAFDVEILLRAKQFKLNVREVPVHWRNSPMSRVRLVRDSLRMLWDVIKLWGRRNNDF